MVITLSFTVVTLSFTVITLSFTVVTLIYIFGSARICVGEAYRRCRGRPRASPHARQGDHPRRVTTNIGPYGPSGWHGACPYTGGVTHTNSRRTNSGLCWGLALLRSEIIRHLGRGDEAYDTLHEMMNLRNTAAVSQLRRQLSEMDSLNEMDEMRVREQRAHFWYAVSIAAVIILALLVFAFFRQHTARLLARKNQELATALDHAQESDRMKTAFVQHISHEIRTPLNIITGFAQVISSPDYDVSPDDRNRMLADISHNTNEITNLVNELLELSCRQFCPKTQQCLQGVPAASVGTVCQHKKVL